MVRLIVSVSFPTFVFFTQKRESAHIFIVNHQNEVLDSLDYDVIEDERIKNEKLERVFISMNISPNRNIHTWRGAS